MNNLIYNFSKKCKYFFYFNLFLNSLLFNLIYYKVTNKINEKLIKWLYYTINLNGCILIKIVQWINTNTELLNIDNINNKYIYNLFSSFYEDCDIHDLEYTKQMFEKEFKQKFNDVITLDNNFLIKSGSIAQVYKGIYKNRTIALKVVHPDIKYQMIFPIIYLKLYKYLVTNIYFLNKYNTIFIFDNFIDNLKNQTIMNNEYKNMKYFYNTYKNNEYILIPEPIISTKNFLIMEFLDGIKFENMDINVVEKIKVISLLNLFIKDNYYFLDYYHSDLHQSNWKVVKYHDFYKIIIYDFGYISYNKFKESFKKLSYYNDTLNIPALLELIYEHCKNSKYTKNEFVLEFQKYIQNLNIHHKEPFCDEIIINLYNFLYTQNIHLNEHMFELVISMILFKKYILKYIMLQKIDTTNTNHIVTSYIYSINLCEKYNIFHRLLDYYEKTYINNPEIKNNYNFTNTYFNDLTSIDSFNI